MEAYDKYVSEIFRFCLSRTSDKELAEDITQESFVKTWQYLCCQHHINNLRAFLYKVALNLIIDQSRKRKNHYSYLQQISNEADSSTEDSTASLDAKLQCERVRQAIKTLPPKYKSVLALRYFEDMKIKKIANRMNESENVISVRISRGLEKLRQMKERKILL